MTRRVAVLLAVLSAGILFGFQTVMSLAEETPPPAAMGISITAELEQDSDGRPVMEWPGAIPVSMRNTSANPVRIWSPDVERGYYQFSLEFVNSRTEQKFTVYKRAVDDEDFWDDMKPGSEIVEIAPGGTCTAYIELDQFAWAARAQPGYPNPNSPDRFDVSIRFESRSTPEAARKGIWIGECRSPAISARFIAPELKTPHDYLWSGFPAAAIELMATNPKSIHEEDDYHCTPLHQAVQFGHAGAVKWLLDHGADVNAIAYNGFTPLHLTRDPEVVRLLLKKHPRLGIRCVIQGQTPLQRAAEEVTRARTEKDRDKWRTIVDLYLQAGAEYDIITAIHRDDLARVKAVAEANPRFARLYRHHNPLRVAAALGRLDICRYLLAEHKVDVDAVREGIGYPIIKEAVAHPEVVRLLIRHGADLEEPITWQGGRTGMWIIGDDATVLHFAAAHGVPESIHLLIDNGVDIFALAREPIDKTPTQTALEVAAAFGKVENAQAILGHPRFEKGDAKARQAALDRSIRIASRLAKTPEQAKLVELLLEAGAKPPAAR